MVMMISDTTLASPAGLIASRYSSRPATTVASTPPATATP